MAQFDVHPNPGKKTAHIPYVVVLQSRVFDGSWRRVVAPLILATEFGHIESHRFNPSFSVMGTLVVLQPLELVSVASSVLKPAVSSLKEDGQRVIDALDELFSLSYG